MTGQDSQLDQASGDWRVLDAKFPFRRVMRSSALLRQFDCATPWSCQRVRRVNKAYGSV